MKKEFWQRFVQRIFSTSKVTFSEELNERCPFRPDGPDTATGRTGGRPQKKSLLRFFRWPPTR